MGMLSGNLAPIQKAWNEYICYPAVGEVPLGSKLFFETVDRRRYGGHPYIRGLINEISVNQKNVLEVGVGVGGDAALLTKNGASLFGIDLTENALQYSKRRFQLDNLKGAFFNASAETLPFKSKSFDVVYSMGVLHHTPRTQTAIQEIHRVLKKDGEAIIMLYYKNLCTYYLNLLLFRGVFKGMLFKMSKKDIVNNLEFKNCPLTKLFSKRQARKMFSDFSTINFSVHFLSKTSVPVLGRILPQKFCDFFAPWFGFHLVIRARK